MNMRDHRTELWVSGFLLGLFVFWFVTSYPLLPVVTELNNSVEVGIQAFGGPRLMCSWQVLGQGWTFKFLPGTTIGSSWGNITFTLTVFHEERLYPAIYSGDVLTSPWKFVMDNPTVSIALTSFPSLRNHLNAAFYGSRMNGTDFFTWTVVKTGEISVPVAYTVWKEVTINSMLVSRSPPLLIYEEQECDVFNVSLWVKAVPMFEIQTQYAISYHPMLPLPWLDQFEWLVLFAGAEILLIFEADARLFPKVPKQEEMREDPVLGILDDLESKARLEGDISHELIEDLRKLRRRWEAETK
jgi:hypothetical protein